MSIKKEAIPQALIERNQWVAWRSTKRPNGKTSKMPVDPHTGGGASTTTSSTWGSIDQAVACCKKKNLAGIGFVFSSDDPFVGIDLDDCLDPNTKTLEPWAAEVVRTFDSYTEITPSGKGVHILAKGVLPGLGKKVGAREIYDRSRFFTVTGNIVPGSRQTIEHRQQAVTDFYRSLIDNPDQGGASATVPLARREEEILDLAMGASNGAKFKTLWDGNTQGYHSPSEADLALCTMLAYWTEGDTAMIDRLFRQSQLFRAKWSGTDGRLSAYAAGTIQKALRGSISNSKIASAKKIYNLTDLGNAERMADMFKDEIRYCHAWRSWLIWDGVRWMIDKTNQINQKAKQAVRSIYQEASAEVDSSDRKPIAKHAAQSEADYRLKAMINLCASEQGIGIAPDELDSNIWLLTCLNGTLDLMTGQLLPHDPKHLITKLVPVVYDPRATCHVWDAFLNRIMAGNDDLIQFLQRAIGYSLTGDTGEQCFFILYGSGANGKSTFLSAISSIMADYSMQTPTETLLVRKTGGITNDVARLKGARFVTASEAEADQRLAEGLIKQMTGQDVISARFLYQELFDFTPTHKIFLATNHKPDVRGNDPAIWRRIKLVPFEVAIPEPERDRKLLSKLAKEQAGILAWAVRGCLDWGVQGLGEPEEVKAATNEYKCEMDFMSMFFSDCCCIEDRAKSTAKELYEAYTAWCSETGEEPLKQRGFGIKLKDKGFKHFRTGDRRWWRGIKLNEKQVECPAEPAQHDSMTDYDTTNHIIPIKEILIESYYKPQSTNVTNDTTHLCALKKVL